MSANLTYYILEGVLVGTIGDRMFHLLAMSGGGGGSTKVKPEASTNNPYMEALKTKKGEGKRRMSTAALFLREGTRFRSPPTILT